MDKIIYVTTNKQKIAEAKEVLCDKYGLDIDFLTPNFEVLEIQSDDCAKVAKFSAKYAAEILKRPVLKSDSGLYIETLGGLPGPYNAYFCNQIGIDHFLRLIASEKNRNARLEHCFAYCEPGKEPVVFVGGSEGTISYEPRGNLGYWHERFYIPRNEKHTLSELKELDSDYERQFWGNAIDQFAQWYLNYNNDCRLKLRSGMDEH